MEERGVDLFRTRKETLEQRHDKAEQAITIAVREEPSNKMEHRYECGRCGILEENGFYHSKWFGRV